jgi:pSer/pThr/pTyr-binding forkhead associated (FHA) protein
VIDQVEAGTQSTGTMPALQPGATDGDWLDEARSGIDEPGEYLLYVGDHSRAIAFSLRGEWTRIGRGLAADIRFDDARVSRRHALVIRQADGVRIVDDRSLNGVFVNGERVEWHELTDGDEISVGPHRLQFVVVARVPLAGHA